MKHTITILLLIFTPFYIFAQQNFQPGYVIQNSGDTLRGEIDNKNWRRNPETITFKTIDNNIKSLGVNDIQEFQVEGNIYKSATVKIETSPVLLKNLEENDDLEFEEKTVFLEAIYVGDKSLYKYRGELEKDHFFIGVNGKYETLIYKKFFRVISGHKHSVYNKEYLKQLREYLGDCSNIDKILKAHEEITSYNMKQIFKKYYKCIDTSDTYESDKKSIELSFGLVAGYTSSKVNLKGDAIAQYKEIVEADIPANGAPTFGISLNLLLEGNRKRWSINNELLYSSYSVETYYKEEFSNTHYYEYFVNLGGSYITMNNMVRYDFVKGNDASIFLELGISNGVALNVENNKTTVKTFSGEVESSESDALTSTRKYEQGILTGIGFKLGKVAFDLRYNKTSGISNISNLPSPVNRFSAILGYSF
ncbi:MAG: hypothetical protein CMO01_26375 [Thalassobius sp.]|nr:hypothetical protein [Thalassovita sp.]